MTPFFLLITGLLIYMVIFLRILFRKPEETWKQREKLLRSKGIVAMRPVNWDKMHFCKQLLGIAMPPSVLIIMLIVYFFIR